MFFALVASTEKWAGSPNSYTTLALRKCKNGRMPHILKSQYLRITKGVR